MICVKDAAMDVVHLSPEWLDFTGLDLDSAVGQGWLAAVHPDDRPMARDTLREAARACRGYSMHYRLMHRSGAGLWVSDGAVASFAPGERSFLGVLGSITEIPAGERPAAARGRVGEFRPLPPMPSTLTAVPRDLLADYLLLARALAEEDGDPGLVEALDVALYLARRRLDLARH